MTEQEKLGFLSAIQRTKLLAGARVILVENSSTRTLRQSSASGLMLNVALFKLGPAQVSWSGPNLQRYLQPQLTRAGVPPSDIALSCVLGASYACFICVANGSGNPAWNGGNQATLSQATKEMQEVQKLLNPYYLQLQNQMQHENRLFSSISNVLKTKHDTVKNSISNMR